MSILLDELTHKVYNSRMPNEKRAQLDAVIDRDILSGIERLVNPKVLYPLFKAANRLYDYATYKAEYDSIMAERIFQYERRVLRLIASLNADAPRYTLHNNYLSVEKYRALLPSWYANRNGEPFREWSRRHKSRCELELMRAERLFDEREDKAKRKAERQAKWTAKRVEKERIDRLYKETRQRIHKAKEDRLR